MAEKTLMALLALLSAPFVWLAKGAELWNTLGIGSDIEKCLDVVDCNSSPLPKEFLLALIAAEDHRNAFHPGIDPIAMIRAAYVRCRFGTVQGASTVEQQFVRVVSGRYERTLVRKLREQALAICISRRREKARIANAYLAIAYFGSGAVGIDGLRAKLGANLCPSDTVVIRAMIARLKYPEPSKPTEAWRTKIDDRVAYIGRRSAWLAGRGSARRKNR